MEDAPIPPHERPWRHPSELGPTAAALEVSPRRSRFLAFSSGAVAAALVAVMVVSITPRGSNAPSAVSATTIPAASIQLRSEPAQSVQIERRGTSYGHAVTLVGAPRAISSAPSPDPANPLVASRVPADDARVIVLTTSFTYDLAWSDLAGLVVPDGTIVVTPDGALVASFVGGELRLLVD